MVESREVGDSHESAESFEDSDGYYKLVKVHKQLKLVGGEMLPNQVIFSPIIFRGQVIKPLKLKKKKTL